jgi:hypothetical protein|tara:strand:- start:601 stop:1134 length:534 start_codon:yes stop_codon:yes gene_type:complete
MTKQKNTTDNHQNQVEAASVNTTPASQERSPRALDSRDAAQRIASWENPINLPDPDPQEGWAFRYIRTALLGETDNTNVSRRFRDGWETCRLEDHPELKHQMMDHKSEWAEKGNIEIGGQLLCKMPQELAEARDRHFRDKAHTQMESVDNIFLKDNDSRMPKQVFERKSRTTFGKDS